jgi:hypothetical protein
MLQRLRAKRKENQYQRAYSDFFLTGQYLYYAVSNRLLRNLLAQ